MSYIFRAQSLFSRHLFLVVYQRRLQTVTCLLLWLFFFSARAFASSATLSLEQPSLNLLTQEPNTSDLEPLKIHNNDSPFVVRPMEFIIDHPVVWSSSKRQPIEEDRGFFFTQKDVHEPVLTDIGALRLNNSLQYAVNLDGGLLVYYHFPNPGLSTTPLFTGRSAYQNKRDVFLMERHIKLCHHVEEYIVSNVIVNYTDLIEANHIVVHDNYIVLDRQTMPMQPELIQTMDSIKQQLELTKKGVQ